MNTWQDLQSAVIVALVGAVPVLAIWFKVWANAKIAELQAKSEANAGRLDQHAAAITDIQQHPGLSVPPLNGPVVSVAPLSLSSVLSMTRSDPVTLSSDTLRGAFPPVSDVLHETPDRLRVGVNDPHALANAVIKAQAGIQKL